MLRPLAPSNGSGVSERSHDDHRSDRRHRPRRQRDRPRLARARRCSRRARSRPRQSPPRLRRARRAAHPCHAPRRPARHCPGIRRDPHGVHRDGIDRDRGRPSADRDQRCRRNLLDRAGHPPIGAQHLGGLPWDQPASPRQHRPVRRLDRSTVLDDPPRDLLGIAARRGARGARVAHLDRPRRQRPHGVDRPSRRGGGRAARAHRPGAMGRAPRPDRTGPHVVAGGARAALGRARRARHLPGRARTGFPRAPHRRRGAGGEGGAAHRARVGDPCRRERLHDRHLPADHRPPPRARWPSSFTSTARHSCDAGASCSTRSAAVSRTLPWWSSPRKIAPDPGVGTDKGGYP